MGAVSLPARGAWIEINRQDGAGRQRSRRSPHGERGLKSFLCLIFRNSGRSRSPHGERGLKFLHNVGQGHAARRSPHGERGLK